MGVKSHAFAFAIGGVVCHCCVGRTTSTRDRKPFVDGSGPVRGRLRLKLRIYARPADILCSALAFTSERRLLAYGERSQA
jgi:hypothetical protein